MEVSQLNQELIIFLNSEYNITYFCVVVKHLLHIYEWQLILIVVCGPQGMAF